MPTPPGRVKLLEQIIEHGYPDSRGPVEENVSWSVWSLVPMQIGTRKERGTMEIGSDDGCKCPRCHDHIPEQFYCRNCGYVPNWRAEVARAG